MFLIFSLYSDPLIHQPYFIRFRLTSLASSSSESSAGEGRLDGLRVSWIVLAMIEASLDGPYAQEDCNVVRSWRKRRNLETSQVEVQSRVDVTRRSA
jgi:hypothetical protein